MVVKVGVMRNKGLAGRAVMLAVPLVLAALACSVVSAPAASARIRQGDPFGGYEVGGLSGSQSHQVAGDFTVPVLSCPSSGIYGVQSGVYMGTRDPQESGFVVAECNAGVASYEAFIGNAYDPGAQTAEFPVHAGDDMSASVSSTPISTGQSFTVDIRDLTHPVSATQSCQDTSSTICSGFLDAFFGDTQLCTGTASSCTLQPVASFTDNKFTGAVVDGGALGSAKPTSEPLEDGGVVAVVFSALSKGKNFHGTFKHS